MKKYHINRQMKSNKYYIVFRFSMIFIILFTGINTINGEQTTLVNPSGKPLDKPCSQKADLYRIPLTYDILYAKNDFYLWNYESKPFYSLDKMFILLSAVAEWKISNPDAFYKSVRTINGAKNRLNDIIPPAIREVLNSYYKSDFCELTTEETATKPVKQEYIVKIIDLFSPQLRELGMEVLSLEMVVK